MIGIITDEGMSLPLLPLRRPWDKIDPAECPGVTAQEATNDQPASLDGAVVFDSGQTIAGTRRVVFADLTVEGGDDAPPTSNETNE